MVAIIISAIGRYGDHTHTGQLELQVIGGNCGHTIIVLASISQSMRQLPNFIHELVQYYSSTRIHTIN